MAWSSKLLLMITVNLYHFPSKSFTNLAFLKRLFLFTNNIHLCLILASSGPGTVLYETFAIITTLNVSKVKGCGRIHVLMILGTISSSLPVFGPGYLGHDTNEIINSRFLYIIQWMLLEIYLFINK